MHVVVANRHSQNFLQSDIPKTSCKEPVEAKIHFAHTSAHQQANRHLIKAARCMLRQLDTPKTFCNQIFPKLSVKNQWQASAYIIKQCPSRQLKDITSNEVGQAKSQVCFTWRVLQCIHYAHVHQRQFALADTLSIVSRIVMD